jgi:hypothetical protein
VVILSVDIGSYGTTYAYGICPRQYGKKKASRDTDTEYVA